MSVGRPGGVRDAVPGPPRPDRTGRAGRRRRTRHRPAGLRSPQRRARSMDASLIVVVVVLTALAFDFTNGFHDTANAMATSIATGAFRPKTAVTIAAVPERGRRLPVGPGGEDDLRWAGRRDAHQSGRDLRRAGRGHPVEPGDLVPRAAVQFVARALRRPDRCDVGGGRGRRDRLQRGGEQDRPAGRAVARGRRPDRGDRDLPGLPGHRAGRTPPRHPGFPARPEGLGVHGRPGPRHQRRAEDHGRDHADPDHRGHAGAGLGAADLGGPVRRPGDRARHLHGWLADHPDPRHPGQRHRARPRASAPRRPAPR